MDTTIEGKLKDVKETCFVCFREALTDTGTELRVYVRACTCACMCVYACVSLLMHVSLYCICVFVYMCICLHMSVVYVYVCLYVCIYVSASMPIILWVCMHLYMSV